MELRGGGYSRRGLEKKLRSWVRNNLTWLKSPNKCCKKICRILLNAVFAFVVPGQLIWSCVNFAFVSSKSTVGGDKVHLMEIKSTFYDKCNQPEKKSDQNEVIKMRCMQLQKIDCLADGWLFFDKKRWLQKNTTIIYLIVVWEKKTFYIFLR